MLTRRGVVTGAAGVAAGPAAWSARRAEATEPITIGFGMAVTSGIVPNGKAALLAMQIWEANVNARGDLLGRPVELVYYDDQSNPASVPAFDLLGYYLPPFAYANMQILAQAVEGAKSLDADKLADYLRTHSFKTIVGDIIYGQNGEWSEARTLVVQFQDVKSNDLDQFKEPKIEVILWPEKNKTGVLIYPYRQ